MELFLRTLGLILTIAFIVFLIFCAVRTAQRRRWVWFVLGFIWPPLWLVGFLLGPRKDSREPDSGEPMS
jgi:hypothetical protein